MSLPPLHPVIVHIPIALIIVSLLFELMGRALDLEWWRKAAFALLIVGALGAVAAVVTGNSTGDAAEHQGVSEQAVDQHGDAGRLAMWLALLAVATRALGKRAPRGRAAGAMAWLALAAHVAAAAAVGVAGFRGGLLVFHHGAGVKVHEKLVPSDGPPKAREPGDKD